MDFNTFVIAGPNTLTLTLGYLTGGSVTTAAGVTYTAQTQCQTDTFSITGVTGGTPPVICGTNSGYHGKSVLWFQYLLSFGAFFKNRHIRKNYNIKFENVFQITSNFRFILMTPRTFSGPKIFFSFIPVFTFCQLNVQKACHY